MAEVARINSLLVNEMTNVEMYMDRRFQLAVDAPADVAYLQEVGPILKFHLCINQSDRHFVLLHRTLWRAHTTPPTTILNHRIEFPAAQAWPHLNDIFSLVGSLIPDEFLSDVVNQIFTSVAESSANPEAAVINLTAVLTVVHPVIARRASAQVVDSALIVDDEPEMTPAVDIPRRPARRSARDLKERYLLSASEAEDNLGDCSVCLDELKVVAGKSSWSEVLKMPCSHMFHHRCIFEWLKMSDTCPMCRAAIP